MAQKTVLVDDLDGTTGEGVTATTYTLGNTDYEIDLTAGHAEELHGLVEQISRFVAASRTPAAANGTAGGTREPFDATAIRKWAHDNGIEVSERGRIAAGVVRQWRKETTETASTVA